jgi:hypothetical protein
MARRFIQLAVRARRLVRRASSSSTSALGKPRLTGRRQVGSELTQFSFRLALVIDVMYVGVGALGGAAVGRAIAPPALPADSVTVASARGPACAGDVPAITVR